MKKVKTSLYFIIDAFTSESRDDICIISDSEVKMIKNSDIPIMDTQSTGSAISKYMVEKVFIKANIIKQKDVMTSTDDEKVIGSDDFDNESEVVIEVENEKQEIKEFTLDDFIDDFKI